MLFLAAIFCLSLSIFGFKSLHLFAASNGLVDYLTLQIGNKVTPAGKHLRTLTTGGRSTGVDLQINAVASFQLIFCENISRPDVNVVGFWFATSWAVSWMLIVLESLRDYSRSRLMSWITIPGIFIYNQSHAVFTSLYLAIRLAVAAPPTTRASLTIDTIHLHAIPWSFLLGNILPLFIMAMPGLYVSGFNTKHIVASLYQQWNLYITLLHVLLVALWDHNESRINMGNEGADTLLFNVRPVYILAFVMSIASVWIPISLSCAVRALQKIRKPSTSSQNSLTLTSLFIPPSPWSKLKCRNAFEGGKWLLQWDGIIGGLSTAVWVIALYAEAHSMVEPQEGLGSLCMRLMWYMILGGPMGVATGVLWERDILVLQQNLNT